MQATSQGPRSVRVAVLVALLVAATAFLVWPRPEISPWEPDIAAFERQDLERPAAREVVVFVGSSTIRLWDLQIDFPGVETLNRGFGGSQIADSVQFLDRLVLKHRPRAVVLYAGDNDIAHFGKPAPVVADDFAAFLAGIRAVLPHTRVVFIALKPSTARWEHYPEMMRANAAIAAHCAADSDCVFVDVGPHMLDHIGEPRPDLLAPDGIHLSEAGYRLWTELVAPTL